MYWNIVLISGALTYITIFLTHKKLAYVAVRIGKYKIHHSVFGVILLILGRVATDSFQNMASAVGLGMYVSHVFEEWILNKVRFSKAMFIFVTPFIPHNNKD